MKPLLILGLALATGVVHVESLPHYNDWRAQGSEHTCGETCQETLASIPFEGDIEGDKWTVACSNRLRTKSIYMCMNLYCSAEEIKVGVEHDNAYCLEQGGVALTPYSAFSHSMSREQLRRKAISERKLWNTVAVTLEPVNGTIIPYPAKFELAYKTAAEFYWNIGISEVYGWAMYVFWGAVIFISMAAKLLSYFIPAASGVKAADPEGYGGSRPSESLIAKLMVKANYTLFTPATIGKRSMEPYWWCTVPPLIETLTILAFVVINVVLCAVNYEAFIGNTYYATESITIWRYIGDRTGIIALANLPIVWLFAQRNNILIWFVGWTPSTFNHFHRWVARLAVLEAIIHGVSRTVQMFQTAGYEEYALAWEELYFRMGVVALIVMSLMLPLSVRGLRNKAYEVFLSIHYLFAILFLVSTYYHVRVWATQEFNAYIWACAAIWGFDRLLRAFRLVVLNIFRSQQAIAHYSPDSQLISLEVPINPVIAKARGSFYYVYVLHGRTFFQSHPFTASYAVSTQHGKLTTLEKRESIEEVKVEEMKGTPSIASSDGSKTSLQIDYSRIRFFMRPSGGFTKALRDQVQSRQSGGPVGLRVLIEGPYSMQKALHRFDNVLFVVSGSGITVGLQHVQNLVRRKQSGKRIPHVHVVWAVRQESLLHDFQEELQAYRSTIDAQMTVHSTSGGSWPTIVQDERETPVGKTVSISGWDGVIKGRPNVYEYVVNERRGRAGSLAVVSCSPPAMADDTQQAVVDAMKDTQMDIELVPETFGW